MLKTEDGVMYVEMKLDVTRDETWSLCWKSPTGNWYEYESGEGLEGLADTIRHGNFTRFVEAVTRD